MIHRRLCGMHVVRGGLLVVLSALPVGSPTVQAQEAPAAAAQAPTGGLPSDPDIEAATKLAREGKFDEALAKIRKAAEAHKEWPTPLLILARLHFMLGQNAQGRQALEQAAIETPEDPSVALTFASIDLAEGRRHDASLNAHFALTLVPKLKDPSQGGVVVRDARKILAAVSELRQDWNTARDHLLLAIESDSKDGTLRQSLGRVYFQMGKPEDALRELTTAHKETPTIDSPEVSMALLYARSGHAKTAEEWFNRALKADTKGTRPRIAYAVWLMEQGRPEAAQPIAEEIAALGPDSKDLSKLRGLIAFHRRDLVVAEAIYEELAKESPNEPGVASLLALSLVDQQDRAKRTRGLQLAESLARRFPRSPEVLATLGHAHDRNGHPQDAEINLRAAISTGRAAPETAYFLARVLADRGRSDEARKLLVAAISQPGLFAYRKDASELLKSLPASTNPR